MFKKIVIQKSENIKSENNIKKWKTAFFVLD